MNTEATLTILRKMYAAALADSVKQLDLAGVLAQVTAAKREEQLAQGKAKAALLGIAAPEEAFTKAAEIFDCADWTVATRPGGFEACASRCMLAALAKKMGTPSPCRVYCLDPIEGIIRSLAPAARLEVTSTLFESDGCRASVRF